LGKVSSKTEKKVRKETTRKPWKRERKKADNNLLKNG